MNFIIIIFVIIFIFLSITIYCDCICDYIFDCNVKKVVINEDKNNVMLFKINDSVSEMKTLNIIYQREEDDDLKT